LPQSTASSKPEVQVIAILEHYRLLDRFTAISGAQPGPGGRGEGKSEVIARAIERLAAVGVDVSRPVLIGDRHHDVEGGAEHGIPVIFAGWGFGDPAEAEGAVASAESVAELRELILPGQRAR
ncbi:MAG: HAD hydrolase-like protein, partial [Actinobacteria bacterium]|nr:HAD hydrolase-like protein [Actinomycetota bacterium]